MKMEQVDTNRAASAAGFHPSAPYEVQEEGAGLLFFVPVPRSLVGRLNAACGTLWALFLLFGAFVSFMAGHPLEALLGVVIFLPLMALDVLLWLLNARSCTRVRVGSRELETSTFLWGSVPLPGPRIYPRSDIKAVVLDSDVRREGKNIFTRDLFGKHPPPTGLVLILENGHKPLWYSGPLKKDALIALRDALATALGVGVTVPASDARA